MGEIVEVDFENFHELDNYERGSFRRDIERYIPERDEDLLYLSDFIGYNHFWESRFVTRDGRRGYFFAINAITFRDHETKMLEEKKRLEEKANILTYFSNFERGISGLYWEAKK